MSTLAGVYVRNRHANQVRSRALACALAAFDQEGIEALVLKGGALMHLLYPDPALRPMSDLDLLVRPADMPRARAVLADLGFIGAGASAQVNKSLPTVGTYVEGVWVGFELHENLFERGHSAPGTLEDLGLRRTFSIGEGGPLARTLGYEDTLWHLCEHLRFHTTVFLPWRLIWVADIVGMVERFGEEMDWDDLARRRRTALDILALVNALVPLSIRAMAWGGAAPRTVLRGVGEDFQGWPRASLAAQRAKGWRGILRDTLWPPEWWLRLHCGVPPTRSLAWGRVAHLLEIGRWAFHLAGERMGRAARILRRRVATFGRRLRRAFGSRT